jgi:hypothetical protein
MSYFKKLGVQFWFAAAKGAKAATKMFGINYRFV